MATHRVLFPIVRRIRHWKFSLFMILLAVSGICFVYEFSLTRHDKSLSGTHEVFPKHTVIRKSSINCTTLCATENARVGRTDVIPEETNETVDLRHTNDKLKKIFDAGAWQSSTVTYDHHVHYEVNCSGIIMNDPVAIAEAKELLYHAEASGYLQLPTDEVVTSWTRNCDYYTTRRRYPTKPMSHEEKEYPIAYVMLVHKDSAQVERLLRSIYHPQNIYCIHYDSKAPTDFRDAMRGLARCFENVFIASKLENIQYRGFSRLQADINCMQDLVAKKEHKWKYIINLCGHDFPLKTNLEIVRQLKAYKGHNDIPGVFPVQDKWFIGRTSNHHRFVNGNIQQTKIKKPPPPHGAKMYFGNAYYAASREFVSYILTNKTANDILYYLEDSNSPDEHFWVTVNRYPGVPGGYPFSSWKSNVRFIRWTVSKERPPCIGKYVRAVCIISLGYLPYLTSIPHLFVNKVLYEFDPITLQCLEETLDYRTINPSALEDFVPQFPITDLFPDNPPSEKIPWTRGSLRACIYFMRETDRDSFKICIYLFMSSRRLSVYFPLIWGYFIERNSSRHFFTRKSVIKICVCL